MFTEVQIENYKSIQSLKINLGRVNVFIGENGCGKSNILEAIALAGAAAGNKLDNEFLAPRGIRVTEPEFMRSAFDRENVTKEIKINLKVKYETVFKFILQHDNQAYSSWINTSTLNSYEKLSDFMKDLQTEIIAGKIKISDNKTLDHVDSITETAKELIQNVINEYVFNLNTNDERKGSSVIKDFLIYSPENFLLRTFEEEGQIQPLGTKGQGLLKLLRVLNSNSDKINEIKQRLELIDWFDDFKIHQDSDIERTIQIKDRYLDKGLPYFNQRSSNEGFLFLMFYFALFVSDDTPKFFAIDNIENALNPKLCTRLIQELVELAKKYDKQVIFTTHNPAILDGLDLHDDEQRLFTIYRNIDGHTKAKRVYAPEPLDDDDPVPLSEAFMNGYIGGLPNNF
ncbi:AAA family ATPase [Pseudanabaena mucicola]|uniref:AAA family ATPase n=1 Tax=Pseudanabaena mucicola FACHB-723 TaxID=2692860 RepID=A0ABR8A1L8_9CYAN|nr:ATP-binding protein [Pseudanabaena mucicola]MBD2189729.1 AAA family ATPase [Pseudanabaena mucicola FACHB-723]